VIKGRMMNEVLAFRHDIRIFSGTTMLESNGRVCGNSPIENNV